MSVKRRFRSCYDVDRCCSDFDFTCIAETLAVQSEKDSVDIRKMIERYKRDGVLPDTSPTGEDAQFLDVSDIHDYAEVMRRIRSGEEYFSHLPAEIRLQYENDPIAYMDALRAAQESVSEHVPEQAGDSPPAQATKKDTKQDTKPKQADVSPPAQKVASDGSD